MNGSVEKIRIEDRTLGRGLELQEDYELAMVAIEHEFPDLRPPEDLEIPFNAKFVRWRLGIDSLQDVITPIRLTVEYTEVNYPMYLYYMRNPNFCFEHRMYMSAMEGPDGFQHYMNSHGMTHEEWDAMVYEKKEDANGVRNPGA